MKGAEVAAPNVAMDLASSADAEGANVTPIVVGGVVLEVLIYGIHLGIKGRA